MKKIVFLGVLAASLAFVSNASAQGIAGSGHDFSTAGYGTTEICQPCHTPHDADTTVAISPLWNHELTAATYTLYTSTTLTATMAQPSGISQLCLSCHDGTVAVDSFGGVTTGTAFVAATALVGTNLRSEHPVAFTYNTALATADGGLYDPTTRNSGLGGTITTDLLFGGALECASCHDVHDAAGNAALLRVPNTASALCLTCHNK